MPVTRHTPKVPGISPPLASSNPRDSASSEECRAALDVILAAVANLRDYRDRLSAEDHTAVLLDIEAAAEQISWGLESEHGSAMNVVATEKRRVG